MALDIKEFEIVDVNKPNHIALNENLASLVLVDIMAFCEKHKKNITNYNELNIKIGDREIKIIIDKK